MRLLVIATLILIIIGVSSLTYWNRTTLMPFQSADLVSYLTKELSQRELWHQVSSTNSIIVRERDQEKIFTIAKNIAESLTPPGRSLSAIPSRQEALKQELKVREIPYHLVCLDGVEWIVWENESDTDEINQISFNGDLVDFPIANGDTVNEPIFASCP